MNITVISGTLGSLETSILRGDRLQHKVYKTWGLFARDNQDCEVVFTNLPLKASWTEIRTIKQRMIVPMRKSLIGLQMAVRALRNMGCHDFRPSTQEHDFKGIDMLCFHPKRRGMKTVQVKFKHTVKNKNDVQAQGKDARADIYVVYAPGDGVYVNGQRQSEGEL